MKKIELNTNDAVVTLVEANEEYIILKIKHKVIYRQTTLIKLNISQCYELVSRIEKTNTYSSSKINIKYVKNVYIKNRSFIKMCGSDQFTNKYVNNKDGSIQIVGVGDYTVINICSDNDVVCSFMIRASYDIKKFASDISTVIGDSMMKNW